MPLPDDSLEKWEYKEHTKVKHEILSKYLSGWIRILGKRHLRICYFDCFAGRGKYSDGSKGSPLIALETASRAKEKFSYLREITCFFIENNTNNFESLENEVNEEIKAYPKKYEGIKDNIVLINDEFGGALPDSYNYDF